MSQESAIVFHLGDAQIKSGVKVTPGGFSWFPFYEPRELRELHVTVHSGIDDILKQSNPKTAADFLRAMRKVVPYKLHAKLPGKSRYPSSWEDLLASHPDFLSLWNEDWAEDEFLLASADSLMPSFPMEIQGSVMHVRLDLEEFFRTFVKSLRVVGGLEIQRARATSAIRRGGVFHPHIGPVFYPLVMKFRQGSPSLPMGENQHALFSEKLVQVTQGLEAIDGSKFEQSVSDALSENREVLRFLIKAGIKNALGISPAPPNPLRLIT